VLVALFWIDPRTSQLEAKSNAHTTAVLVHDRLEPGDLVVSTHPEHTPVMRLYLGGDYRWATSMGPVADARIMDWRDALERLRAARPAATAEPLVASLRPGQHLLLVQPIIRSARWRASWTALVRRRAMQWERRLDRDPRLVRTLAVPHFGKRPVPRGVRAVLYEVR
jgi:mannosyltransferase